MRPLTLLAAFFFLVSVMTTVFAQQTEEKTPEIDPAALAQMMAKMATPGEPHEHLQSMVGKYKTQSKWYFPGLPEPTMADEGTAEFKSILGGRYVTQEFHSQINGEPMEGFGILGFDNAIDKFVGVWVDNMSTTILETEGKLDEKSGVLKETGTCNSPLGKMHYRMTTTPTKNGFVFVLNQVEGNKETPLGQIEYIKQ